MNLFSRMSNFKTKGPSDCFVGCGIITKPFKEAVKQFALFHCGCVHVVHQMGEVNLLAQWALRSCLYKHLFSSSSINCNMGLP